MDGVLSRKNPSLLLPLPSLISGRVNLGRRQNGGGGRGRGTFIRGSAFIRTHTEPDVKEEEEDINVIVIYIDAKKVILNLRRRTNYKRHSRV